MRYVIKLLLILGYSIEQMTWLNIQSKQNWQLLIYLLFIPGICWRYWRNDGEEVWFRLVSCLPGDSAERRHFCQAGLSLYILIIKNCKSSKLTFSSPTKSLLFLLTCFTFPRLIRSPRLSQDKNDLFWNPRSSRRCRPARQGKLTWPE